MIRTIQDFTDRWQEESDATIKMFQHLTDASLSQQYPGGRTIGRLANHIVETLTELPHAMGLPVEEEHITYTTVAELIDAFRRNSAQLVELVRNNLTDAMLTEEKNMYGETWKNGFSLWVTITHQAHHRAQITVLMRFAGLTVPGVYGPSSDDWKSWGKEPLA